MNLESAIHHEGVLLIPGEMAFKANSQDLDEETTKNVNEPPAAISAKPFPEYSKGNG
jgi:hypothetical protein